ncbi:MAG: GNAT family N-acetyltransferase [Ruminococcaceae bacterium]|jgi:GNAT superfamily N-acetyltransferase|nr:GNAT family N-acetyltransferase [Oscillospiraceae bacterium]
MIQRITGNNLKKLEPLFADWEETMIWSTLQNCMGQAWADSAKSPQSAQILNADFCFFGGEPNEELVKNRQGHDFIIMTPPDDHWAALIEAVYSEKCRKVTRYAIKKEKNVFDRKKLQSLTALPGREYSLQLIDEKAYQEVRKESWSRDFCSQFRDWGNFQQRGVGAVARCGKTIVAGASSYIVYKSGIEIEVDTKKEYRQKGLATACSARLILECLDRGLYPSWDAQNTMSVGLAEKLGYHFSHEYIAYEVYAQE